MCLEACLVKTETPTSVFELTGDTTVQPLKAHTPTQSGSQRPPMLVHTNPQSESKTVELEVRGEREREEGTACWAYRQAVISQLFT